MRQATTERSLEDLDLFLEDGSGQLGVVYRDVRAAVGFDETVEFLRTWS